GQATVNSSGTSLANSEGQVQFSMGDINILSTSGNVSGGFQSIVLNSVDPVTGLDPENLVLDELDITVFPNPTADRVYFKRKDLNGLKYSLINTSGAVLESAEMSHEENYVEMLNHSAGVYYLKIIDQTKNKTVTLSIIKK
ncbi:T9SS type A sorting domain-containing protein, partial [Fulvivirga sp. RKSG066]|uniref:T9SS type A sorting domain-containing protein n=1 Tax=Fulvivirga aurantia TaxID=2529383 RepID=UPI0012BBAE59